MVVEAHNALRTVRIGYLPLTDCAALAVAVERGFDRKYGLNMVLCRESSWAAVRDKLGSGALDAAHALYGLMVGVQLGIGCQQADMAVLMNLTQNGQAITLARSLARQGSGPAEGLKNAARRYTFAHTFPTGNHAMLLNYWLATQGIDPLRQARLVTLPPTQMVAHLREGQIDGFCAGEPWGQRAMLDEVGVTVATSQQIWQDHPGKVLGATAAFAAREPDTCAAMVAALLDAARWIDAAAQNRIDTAQALAPYLGVPAEVIAPRLLGQYQDGMGGAWCDTHRLHFHGDGAVNFPYLSDAIWFMTQQKRWGLQKAHPEYAAVAQALNRIDLYTDGAQQAGVALPPGPMRSSVLIDGVRWDGSDPAGYADSFAIKA